MSFSACSLGHSGLVTVDYLACSLAYKVEFPISLWIEPVSPAELELGLNLATAANKCHEGDRLRLKLLFINVLINPLVF